MSGGANIVEQYAGADVPARIELLIKYYPNFNFGIIKDRSLNFFNNRPYAMLLI